MIFEKQPGVPRFECTEFRGKKREYAVLIPVINEGSRILTELLRARAGNVSEYADVVICDGGSTDGSTEEEVLKRLDVNTLLIKRDEGGQGAQLRMGIWWALNRCYQGIVTIDGNNKDSIEDVPRFIEKLKQGYDFIQGSRFLRGGHAINTPPLRLAAVKMIHAPVISLTAGYRFTDSTNAFRGYSVRYLQDDRVWPLRDVFMTYELLAYLSTRASQIGYKVCEIPVTRSYLRHGKIPTKISTIRGNWRLMKILFLNAAGRYAPHIPSDG